MKPKQMTFDMRESVHRKKAGPGLAARMIAILAVRKEWTKRSVFQAHGFTERECRLGREWSHGRILCGQKGYKLMRYATPAEIRCAYKEFVARIKACQVQASHLISRGHKALNEAGVD